MYHVDIASLLLASTQLRHWYIQNTGEAKRNTALSRSIPVKLKHEYFTTSWASATTVDIEQQKDRSLRSWYTHYTTTVDIEQQKDSSLRSWYTRYTTTVDIEQQKDRSLRSWYTRYTTTVDIEQQKDRSLRSWYTRYTTTVDIEQQKDRSLRSWYTRYTILANIKQFTCPHRTHIPVQLYIISPFSLHHFFLHSEEGSINCADNGMSIVSSITVCYI